MQTSSYMWKENSGTKEESNRENFKSVTIIDYWCLGIRFRFFQLLSVPDTPHHAPLNQWSPIAHATKQNRMFSNTFLHNQGVFCSLKMYQKRECLTPFPEETMGNVILARYSMYHNTMTHIIPPITRNRAFCKWYIEQLLIKQIQFKILENCVRVYILLCI